MRQREMQAGKVCRISKMCPVNPFYITGLNQYGSEITRKPLVFLYPLKRRETKGLMFQEGIERPVA